MKRLCESYAPCPGTETGSVPPSDRGRHKPAELKALDIAADWGMTHAEQPPQRDPGKVALTMVPRAGQARSLQKGRARKTLDDFREDSRLSTLDDLDVSRVL